jgi:hypothetical protein
MSIVTEKYTRRPFEIEAIRITKENFNEVAEWCGGEILDHNGKQYIKVDVTRPLTEKQTRGFIGDWLLKAGSGFKVYTHKAFQHCFIKNKQETPQQETLFDAVEKPAPRIHAFPKGYPEPSTR